MPMNTNAVLTLCDGFTRTESQGSMAECLDELAELTARILRAKGCTILLLSEDEVAQAGLHDAAGFGPAPTPPVIPDTQWPIPLAPPAAATAGIVRGGHGDMESMVSTIMLHQRIIGVIHASSPLQESGFGKDDLDLLGILTPLIAKSIQVIQLQNILKSRFTQIALSKSSESAIAALLSGVMPNPNQVARILAKSFYREMLNAGFNVTQVISAATEVISELTASLRKHKAGRKQRVSQASEVLDLVLQARSDQMAHRPGVTDDVHASVPA